MDKLTNQHELENFIYALINEINAVKLYENLPHDSLQYINGMLNKFEIGIQLGDARVE